MLDQRVLRLGEDALQRVLVEILERRDDRQAADEFGDQAEFEQVLRLDVAEDFAACARSSGACTLAPKPIEVPGRAPR